MANEKIIEITQENYEQVTQSEEPVLIDFWAEWCGPCRMVAPVLDQLADEYDGKIKIAKLNVDDHQALAAQFGVQSIPTFVLMKGGEVADRMMGAMPKQAFEQFISKNVEAAAAG